MEYERFYGDIFHHGADRSVQQSFEQSVPLMIDGFVFPDRG